MFRDAISAEILPPEQEGKSTGGSEGRLLGFYCTILQAGNVLTELLSCKRATTQEKERRASMTKSGAEAGDDRDATGLEGRATGPKGRAESHRGWVPGLDA